MRVLTMALAALLVTGGCAPRAAPDPVTALHEHGPDASVRCADPTAPLGALPPAVPAWCMNLVPGVKSAIRGVNRWTDGFASGVVNGRISSDYRVFELARQRASSVFKTQHFAHNGHWMVDVAGHGAPPGVYEGSAADFATGPNNGGALMRPEAGFQFVDGRLVIEVDVASGMAEYGDRMWPEIVVTTAEAPTAQETNGWYAAGTFGGYPVVACGLPADRLAECRIYDDETITARLDATARAGARFAEGGAPTTTARDSAWRRCAPTQADELCRDRFRLVLEKDAVTLFVNGVRYMEHRGLPEGSRLPRTLTTSTVYVYFASWVYVVEPTVARFHWGRIAINP